MKNLSIQYRISIYTGLCVLTTICALVGVGSYLAHQTNLVVEEASIEMLTEELQQELKVSAQEQAGSIQSVLEGALSSTRDTAFFFAATKQTNNNPVSYVELSRSYMNGMMISLLENNPSYLGIYTGWEPNALDGRDQDFVNETEWGSDATGRFLPYWYRGEENKIEQAPLVGYDSETMTEFGVREGEWYLCPKETKRECIVGPYEYEIDGKMVLMTSLVAPILAQDKFYGNTGIDIKLDFVQQLATKLSQSLYEGQGNVQIISHNGTIAADSAHRDRLGKMLKTYSTESLAKVQSTQSNKQATVGLSANGEIIEVMAPMKIGRTGVYWVVRVELPVAVLQVKVLELEEIMGDAQVKSTLMQTALGAVLFVIAISIILWMARSITTPLKETVARLKDLAEGEGDLTHRLEVSRADECGEVAQWINQFLDKLQTMMRDLASTTEKVSASAEQTTQVSAMASSGIQGQRTQLDAIASAITEMSAAAQEVAQNASQAEEAAASTDKTADSGKRVVGDTANCIQSLASEVASAADVISRLEENANDIGSILDVIQGVAEQTNLLALNAAIEAARAGEQGRGFAVVADEVRVLAQRTQDATTEIHRMIENLQNGTQEAVAAMGRGRNEAERSVESSQAAAEALNEIQESVALITQMNTQIANAAKEQNTVAEEISRNVNEIGHAADEVAGAAQQSEQASHKLNELAVLQSETIKQFKIS